VLFIEVVGWLWPDNVKSQSDRVVMIAGARQTRQKEKAAKVSQRPTGGSGRPYRA
jgi:hypothetical protein